MDRKITLNHITKIEGHASLNLGIENGKVTVCELGATEGARYFEGIVKGRKYYEAHEMTSRICGICSCGHVIAAITAVENALGYVPSEQTKKLRTLLTLGERIRSHATHLYFLALPDYLGYESALAMAPKFNKELQVALNMMKVGNETVKLLGSRDLHPVSATIGGWLHLPTQDQLDELAEKLKGIKKEAVKTCELFFSLTYPKLESEGEYFSLIDANEYAMMNGTFGSKQHTFDQKHYLEFLKEYHEEYSTANFVVKKDHRYMTSALTRLNNNYAQLSKDAQALLKKSPIKIPSKNPYLNNVAQAIELVHAIDHAVEICSHLKIKHEPVDKINPRAGTGVGAIEVPRGVLWHEYTLDENGTIVHANIITPTAQNLLNMQEDIRMLIPTIMQKSKEEMIMDIEKLIRSYDPCFSCSAHFLEVNWV